MTCFGFGVCGLFTTYKCLWPGVRAEVCVGLGTGVGAEAGAGVEAGVESDVESGVCSGAGEGSGAGADPLPPVLPSQPLLLPAIQSDHSLAVRHRVNLGQGGSMEGTQ